MLFERGFFSSNHASEIEMALKPWDVQLEINDPIHNHFELEYLNLPGMSVYRERYNGTSQLIGVPPPNRLMICAPVGNLEQSSILNDGLLNDQVYATNFDLLDINYGANHENLVIEIDLTHKFENGFALPLEKLTSQTRQFALAQSTADVIHLQNTLRNVLRLGSQISPSRQLRGISAISIEIQAALTQVVIPNDLAPSHIGSSAAVRAVKTMLEHLHTHLLDWSSVSELCANIGVQQRTLERGVRAQFDCTVVQFLRKWRLTAARQRLVAIGPNEGKVSEIAMSFGFFDLGRFASAYRTCFGEYPSETLAASSRQATPLLLLK
ncbi:helix-turn-helix transcriptional regulator [Shimia sagamensis]|uniref:AraC-type DNA-binding protein n=1 Tax=Shimia sagamensis TaxID=1566352 RepID=A0ABY1NUU7_9RHOB|nr:helix-turn-helix transcriptional regulator [Shimia sagamensis]SMP16516.1 AraC-type DNA-binding protein [Shimia sagamensis]